MVERADIIGVPMDLGASRRGVDMGPYAIRHALLHERLAQLGVVRIEDHGNLPVPVRDVVEEHDANGKYFPVIERVCRQLADLVEAVVRESGFPVVLGGDHSIAMGTLAGLTRAREIPPALIWIDAHSDINSPDSSPSGNVHGMPLWFILRNGYADPKRTVQIGLRDVDESEKPILRQSGIRAFSMNEVDRLGMTRVMEETLTIATGPIHVSFDMDGIDPSEAPGTGTPVRGGLTYREAHLAMEMIAETGRSASIEVTEVNPILDNRNQTAALAVGLICSALGKSIL